MAPLKNPVMIAQIGAPHGIKGEVRVKSFTGDPMALADYGPLSAKDGRSYEIASLRPAKNMLVVRFKNVATRNDVEKLNRLELYIDRSVLPDDNDEDEFYITDLVGMRVHDEAGIAIGKVIDVPNFGAEDLLEIEPVSENGKRVPSFYLPFSRAAVPDIDFDAGTLTIIRPVEVSGRQEQ